MLPRAALLLLLCVSAAWAGDGDKPQPAAEPVAPVKGRRFRISLANGGSLTGVVLGDHVFERRDGMSWVGVQKNDPGAGVRLFFVRGADGFVYLPMKVINTLEDLGELEEREGVTLAGQRVSSSRRAEDERDRLRKERIARAEAAKAKAVDEATKTKAAEAEKAKTPLTAEEQLARYTALLAKFPPEKWTPDTPKEIQQRVLLMDLFPDDTEKEFLAVYDEWLKAYTAWKAGQDKSSPPAAGK